MNLVDALAIILVAFAVFAGWRSGALPQVGGLLGAVLGGLVGILALPHVIGYLSSFDPLARAVAVIIGLLVLVGIGEGFGSAIGQNVRARLGRGLLSVVDRVGGAGVGLAQGILVVWLAGGLLAAGPIPRLAGQAQTSVIVRTLGVLLPAPTEIADDLGRVLDASGLPDVFVGLEPLPAPPVDRPSDPRASAIVAKAEASTVKVTSAACGSVLTGTGFAIGSRYVVTNAHVVAGSHRSRLNLGGRMVDAVTVVFDPAFDIALLYAAELSAPPLRLASVAPDRGVEGAALGFPGGGALTVIPAAVTRRINAEGRDIYGGARVRRDIIELRATINRGDSGGPFVLENGTIGGVIFAESKTDEEVGYALSPVEVAVRVNPGLGRTGAVSTGECIG